MTSSDQLSGQLRVLEAAAKEAISHALSYETLQQWKSRYLGKKGELSALMASLASAAPGEKKALGQQVNLCKRTLEVMLEEASSRIEAQDEHKALRASAVDISFPARERWSGTLHPLTHTTSRILSVLTGLGFTVAEGPEVEHDFYNFQALNFPKDHPARAMQDTFFVAPDVVLRTHTSPVQIRTMLGTKPPVRIICPGKVYRRDADVSHSPMFHQVEGLWVDKEVSMADLKGVLRAFAERLFGSKTQVRLRPSYFPFVEPGAEVDVTCLICGGTGCRVCKHTGYLEILGCGMVHPNEFLAVGYDPEEFRGFAFGMGVERIAMLLHGVDDIRLFFENDLRFLRQFS